jgi:hypothetical protein
MHRSRNTSSDQSREQVAMRMIGEVLVRGQELPAGIPQADIGKTSAPETQCRLKSLVHRLANVQEPNTVRIRQDEAIGAPNQADLRRIGMERPDPNLGRTIPVRPAERILTLVHQLSPENVMAKAR